MSVTKPPARGRAHEPVEVCAGCGHPKTQHGTTGTHPCLAAVGDLVHREFCTCDAYHRAVGKAA